MSLIATVVGVPAAWSLMEGNLFIPMWIGSAFIASTLPIVFFIPETLRRSERPDEEDTIYANAELSTPQDLSVKSRVLKFCSDAKEATSIMRAPILLGLSFTFLFQSFWGRTGEYQYLLASERFHWKLKDVRAIPAIEFTILHILTSAQASFLMPIGSVANFVVLIVILPYLYHLMTKRNFTSMTKDLIVVRGSLLFLIIGCLILAWAPLPAFFCAGVLISGCGVGLYSALRSLVTSLVHPDQVSRLYAIMAIGDTLGTMLYSPLVSKGYGWGIKLGGHWTGMVFLICALVYVIVSIPAWLVKKPTKDMDVHG